jgi:hypothetical protein
MNVVIALLIVATAFAVCCFATVLFLGKEMFKKFRFMRDFVNNSRSLLELNYEGAKEYGWDKGMRNIVIRAKEPFSVLVGFELTAPVFGTGFDYYGFTNARRLENGINDEYVAVISTYLGNGPCLFQFFLNCDAVTTDARVSTTDDDQKLKPAVVYPPHLYQRLGFYA